MVTPEENIFNVGTIENGVILQLSAKLGSNKRQEMIKHNWLRRVIQKRIKSF